MNGTTYVHLLTQCIGLSELSKFSKCALDADRTRYRYTWRVRWSRTSPVIWSNVWENAPHRMIQKICQGIGIISNRCVDMKKHQNNVDMLKYEYGCVRWIGSSGISTQMHATIIHMCMRRVESKYQYLDTWKLIWHNTWSKMSRAIQNIHCDTK